jgi:hypothetical protein
MSIWFWCVLEYQVDLRVYVKILNMARIYTLIIALFIGATSFAQLSVTIQNSEICAGDTTWLKASGMTLYGWSDSTNLDNFTGDSVNFTTTSPGMYSITVLGYTVFPLDTDTVSVMITVNANPSASISSSAGGVICEGSSTELAVMSGLSSYMWAPPASLNNDTTDTVLASPTSMTTYYVTVSDTNGCSATDSITIDVLAAPSVSITSSAAATSNSICQGNSATLTAVAPTAATYEWSPVGSLNDPSAAVVTASPNSSTNYTLQVTDSNGCSATATYQLNVSTTIPSIIVQREDSIICVGDTVDIELLTSATIINWTPSNSVDDPTAKIVKVFPTSTTTYTVDVNRQGCENSIQIEVEVLDLPAFSVSQSSNGAPICLDETDLITVTCPECISYTWQFPNSSLTTTRDTQSVSPNTVGPNIISVSGVNLAGCQSSETVTVTVDDCFIGTPFPPLGIASADEPSLDMITRAEEFEFVGNGVVESLEVFNLLGEKIYSDMANQTTSIKFSTTGLSSGVYIASITMNGQVMVEKFYIQ